MCAMEDLPAMPARQKPGLKKKVKAGSFDARSEEVKLEERVQILEQLVFQLCEARRKRSDYMKVYMQDYRSEGKG